MSSHTIRHLREALGWTGDVPLRWTKGLSVEEINKITRGLNICSFCGVASRETIHHVSQVFKIREGQPSSCIVNSAPENQDGEHWFSLRYDSCSEWTRMEYYDSLGLVPFLPEVICILKELSPFHPVVANEKTIQNSFNHQSPACGYHSIYFLIARDNPELLLNWEEGGFRAETAERVDLIDKIDASTMYKLYDFDGRYSHLNDVKAMQLVERLVQEYDIKL